MTLCRQKVTKQGQMCRFPTTIIENSAFAIFMLLSWFSSRNWYHEATAPISTVLFTLCPISWRNIMQLVQNWDNQNQQAKSFQMRYNSSKLNNQNHQIFNVSDIMELERYGTSIVQSLYYKLTYQMLLHMVFKIQKWSLGWNFFDKRMYSS